MCPRRQRRAAASAAAIIEDFCNSAEPKEVQAVFRQVLPILEAHAEVIGDAALPVQGVRVLQACGFVKSSGRYVLPAGADTQTAREARDLIECLLLSIDEKGCSDTTASTASPEGGSGSGAGSGGCSDAGGGGGGSSGGGVAAATDPSGGADAGDAAGRAGAQRDPAAAAADEDVDAALAAAVAAEEGVAGVRGAATDSSTADGAGAAGPATASVGGAGSGTGSGGAAASGDPAARDNAIAGAADGLAGAGETLEDRDRALAERLAKEEEPKILTFERFRGEEVVVDPNVVEEITRFCMERGEKYVDPQFPPMNRSLYMSAWEADHWECHSCFAKTKLPPTPPLPKSREEAQKQEEDFRTNTPCSACGAPPPYLTQVRYFTRPAQWLRPGDRCEGCEAVYAHLPNGRDLVPQMCPHFVRDSISHATVGSAWKLIREAARPEDVCQGGLGNCWFAGALSVVAQLPHLIDRLFLTKECNPWGVYYVQLCHAGQWRGLVLDDLFPTSLTFEGYFDGQMIYYSRGGSLCYLQAARRQLWVPLVEKAAAKLYGSYGSLKGGTLGEALALFTGFPTQRIRLYVTKAEKEARAKRRTERENRRMQRLIAGDASGGFANEDSDDSDGNDDLTWITLLSCRESGYLMGMGCTEEGCEKTKHHIVEEMGLQAPHAYGILDLREVTVNGEIVRMMKIRNPWGERAPRTWKGDWGKDSAKWTPELQRELGVVNSSGVPMDDPMSIFWMSFKDVKQYFGQAEICRVHSDWHEVRLRAWLPSAVGPGEALDLTVFRKTSVDIALWQEKNVAREGALGARSTNVDVGFAVLRSLGETTDGQLEYELIDYAERSCSDDVSKELVLEGGYVYRLVPLSYGQILEPAPRCAVVAVHAVHPVELKKVSSSWRNLSYATFEAARKRGNRWTDRTHSGVYYWMMHEPAGCVFAVENSSNRASAVQVDASESLGFLSSRGCPGTVALLPPRTRQVTLVLALSPGATYTRLSVFPQPVPVDLASPVEASDDVHRPLPLMPESLRGGRPPPPSEEILRRAPPLQAREAKPTTQRAAAVSGGASSAGAAAVAADATVVGGGEADEDDDLAAALRLSLEAPSGASASAAAAQGDARGSAGSSSAGAAASTTPASGFLPSIFGWSSVLEPSGSRCSGGSAPPQQQPSALADDERTQLQARAKQLFTMYRAQGLSPTDSAARAGDEARRAVGVSASAV